jgi:hypothetical protein
MLPPDLRTAEAELLAALRSALAADPRGRWTVELRFEGLRLLAPVLRLAEALEAAGTPLQLLFADAGAAALARRDGADLASRIASFSDALRRREGNGSSSDGGSASDGGNAAAAEGEATEQAGDRSALAGAMAGPEPGAAPGPDPAADRPVDSHPPAAKPPQVLLLVAPSQAEYEVVEPLCQGHPGAVVLINPSLEDAAVGIGSVARQRRRGFLAGWTAAYALIPRGESALRRSHPGDWELYRLDPDGYRAVATFPQKPDSEQQEAALAGGEGGGLGATLRSVDRLLEGLQN